MRTWLESARMALSSVSTNRLRAFLTTLGVIIGIVAVTLMGTLISGLDRAFERSIAFMSRDVLFISKHKWFSGREAWWEVRNRRNLEVEYADRIQDLSQYALAVAPVLSRTASVTYRDREVQTVRTLGTSPEYIQTVTFAVERGRFFTPGENRGGAPVCVLGYDVANELFENDDPVGKRVRFGPHPFRVIGVMERQGKFLGLFSQDNRAIIPLGTFQRIFARRGWTQIQVKVPPELMEEAQDELTGVMRRIRGLKPLEKDDFAINQQEAFRSQYRAIKFAIGGTGVFITVLSLVVGGIGIMNIMFVSVKERTREIGVRKALGATRRAIMIQFLTEAVLICGLAGGVGLVLAFVGSGLIDRFIFPSVMPVWLAVLAFILSLSVGVISGLAPSYQAARVHPIESLRYE
ncbi:MAG: ABC transporter permease [Fidelibacterota bacterium]